MLEEKRKEIDEVDEKIIELLEKRFVLVEGLKEHKTTLTDEEREEEILGKASSEQVREVYRLIFDVSKKIMK